MKIRIVWATGLALLVAATACSACSSSTSGAAHSSTTAPCPHPGPWGWCGTKTAGYLAPNEPDVNRDGKVVIGILSPGDTHDHGYYESFVDEADTLAKAKGWTVVTIDKVPASDAAADARNLCRQKVDMVAIAASTLPA